MKTSLKIDHKWIRRTAGKRSRIILGSDTGNSKRTLANSTQRIPAAVLGVNASEKTSQPIPTPVKGSKVLSSDARTAPQRESPS